MTLVTDTAAAGSDRAHDALHDTLAQALRQELPGLADGRLQLDSLRVVQMRRSSSRQRNPHPYTVCLELALHEAAGGRRHGLRLYGKACRDGASLALYASAARQPLAAVEAGPALAHLPSLDMVCWAWPNDPGLPQLRELLDPTALWARLPDAAREGASGVLSVQALRYEPEDRATLRCVLAMADGSRREIFGKTFGDDRAPALQQRFEWFHALSGRDAAAPRVALPLGIDAGTRALWQAAAPGRPLLALEADDAVPVCARVGRALAVLHGAPLQTPQQRSVAHWTVEIGRRAKKIARVLPPLAARAAALAARLEMLSADLPAPQRALIHGDFHPDQVWVHDGRPLFFDFDEFALGDPMEDLASFVTRWREADAGRAASGEAALLAAYREAAPGRWHAGWLQWHLAVQALLQAGRAFVFQGTGWPQRLERWLALAERIAAAPAAAPVAELAP